MRNGQTAMVNTKRKLDINIQEYLKMVKFLKEFQYIPEEQNMLANLKIPNHTDMVPSFGKMVINTLENGKMARVMETEQKYGTMEEHMQEHLKMTNYMAMELFIFLMAKST